MKNLLLYILFFFLALPTAVNGQASASCSQIDGMPFGPMTIDHHKVKERQKGEVNGEFGAKGSGIIKSIVDFLMRSFSGSISGGRTIETEPVNVELEQEFNRYSCVCYKQAIARYRLKMVDAGLVSYLEKWWEDELAEKIAAQAELDYGDQLYRFIEREPAPAKGAKSVPPPLVIPPIVLKPNKQYREDCETPTKINFVGNNVRIFVPCTAYARLAIEYWDGEKAAKPFHSTTVKTSLEPIVISRVRFANPKGRLIMRIFGLPNDIHGRRTFLGEFMEDSAVR